MQLWKVSVPSGGRGGFIFVASESWFQARGICRRLYQDEALEKNWREMEMIELSTLLANDSIFFLDGKGVIVTKIVNPTPKYPKTKKRGKRGKK
jgi:hypothetical protein